MFGAWFAMLVYPVVRPIMRAWIEELWFAALMFAALPVVNALTTQRHLGVTLPNGDWTLAAFDLTSLAFAVFFAMAARKVTRRISMPATATKRNRRAAALEHAADSGS